MIWNDNGFRVMMTRSNSFEVVYNFDLVIHSILFSFAADEIKLMFIVIFCLLILP